MPGNGLSARGRANALARKRPADDPVVVEARRDLAEESIARFVTKHLATAPELRPDQRERLAALFRSAR